MRPNSSSSIYMGVLRNSRPGGSHYPSSMFCVYLKVSSNFPEFLHRKAPRKHPDQVPALAQLEGSNGACICPKQPFLRRHHPNVSISRKRQKQTGRLFPRRSDRLSPPIQTRAVTNAANLWGCVTKSLSSALSAGFTMEH